MRVEKPRAEKLAAPAVHVETGENHSKGEKGRAKQNHLWRVDNRRQTKARTSTSRF